MYVSMVTVVVFGIIKTVHLGLGTCDSKTQSDNKNDCLHLRASFQWKENIVFKTAKTKLNTKMLVNGFLFSIQKRYLKIHYINVARVGVLHVKWKKTKPKKWVLNSLVSNLSFCYFVFVINLFFFLRFICMIRMFLLIKSCNVIHFNADCSQ